MTRTENAAYVDIVAVRHDATAPAGQTTVIRLLGLLPAHWASCIPEVAADRLRVRIALTRLLDRVTVRRAVTEVFTDGAMRGWSQVA